MIYKLYGEVVNNKQFRTKNGNQYPSNWIKLATDDEIISVGIQILTEVFPTILLPILQRYNGSYTDSDTARTYSVETGINFPGLISIQIIP